MKAAVQAPAVVEVEDVLVLLVADDVFVLEVAFDVEVEVLLQQ